MVLILSVLLSSASGAIYLPADATLCEGRLQYSGTYDLESPRRQVTDLLGRRIVPSLLVEFLVHHPLLESLGLVEAYASGAGVSENYSLREHTRMVLDLFRAQAQFYELGTELARLVAFALLVHDVGKPAAVAEFVATHGRAPETRDEFRAASSRQSFWTMRVLPQICAALHFTARETDVILALVRDDLVGAVVVGQRPPALAATDFKTAATAVGLDPARFFAARTLMYVADAGSYPGLRYGREVGPRPKPPVFVEEFDGRLTPTAPAFHELTSLLQN